MEKDAVKDRRKLWQLKFAITFLNWAIATVTAFLFISYFIVIQSVLALSSPFKWRVSFIIFQVVFSGAVVFVFLVTIFLVLQRAIGPIPRIDRLLENVLDGDTAQRMAVRERDILYAFVIKVNRLIELLDQKAKK